MQKNSPHPFLLVHNEEGDMDYDFTSVLLTGGECKISVLCAFLIESRRGRKAMGTKLSKEQVQQLIKDNDLKTAEDVQNVLKDLFKDTLQEMLPEFPRNYTYTG